MKDSEKQPDDQEFCAPGHTDLVSLTDGRVACDFKSCYPRSAWVQIIGELVYLLILLLAALYSLLLIAKVAILGEPNKFFPEFFGEYPANQVIIVWISVTLGGVCGGCAASLKWLYHTVAKQRWHRDRIIWRLVVPILAAVLSGFLGLMVHVGFVSNNAVNEGFLSDPAMGASFGFFIGLFSDNVLASLQNLAFRIFGTVDEKS